MLKNAASPLAGEPQITGAFLRRLRRRKMFELISVYGANKTLPKRKIFICSMWRVENLTPRIATSEARRQCLRATFRILPAEPTKIAKRRFFDRIRNMNQVIWILINCNSIKEAKFIGSEVLKKRVSTCFDIIPRHLTSYYWPPKSGKIETNKGATLILETFN